MDSCQPLLRGSYPDTLDGPYIADAYEKSSDHSLSGFLDCNASYFNQPLTSLEFPTSKPAILASAATMAVPGPAPHHPATLASTPFGQLQYFPTSFFDTLDGSLDQSLSPQSQYSRTPSPCYSDPHPPLTPASQGHQTPRQPAIKREPARLPASPPPSPPPRKRSRPCSAQSAARTLHNQVERKYRESLNTSLERLRHAIPTLPQNEDSSSKPSKGAVLEGAIDYIARLERERDTYREECDKLRALAGGRLGF